MVRTKIPPTFRQKIISFLSYPLFWILVALGVRLAIVYFQYSGDVNNHIGWAQAMLKDSTKIYNQDFIGINTPNYPPVILYIFAFFYRAYLTVSDLVSVLHYNFHLFPGRWLPAFSTTNMMAAFLKLPAIFADLGIGYLIYHWHFPERRQSIFNMLMYLFNPAVIYISTVWGQIESIPLYFLVLSLLAVLRRTPRSQISSHVFFVMAVLCKQTALWLLPIFLLVWIKEQKFKKILFGFTLQGFLFFFSYYLVGYLPIASIKAFLDTLSGSSTFISDSAWNIWYWFYQGMRLSDSTMLGFLSIRTWSILLLGLVYLCIIWWLIKHYTKANISLALLYISLADFFLQTRVHERHLAPVLVFALLISGRKQIKKTVFFVAITIYHLANLLWTLKLPFI